MPLPRVIFDEEALSERGTSTAIFEYAKALKLHCGVESIIIYNTGKSDAKAVQYFSDHFTTVGYANDEDRAFVVRQHPGSVYYYLRVQKDDVRAFRGFDVACHDVFDFFPLAGTKFAYVSEWLSDFMTNGEAPAVPHIVDLPKPKQNNRRLWSIPEEFTVVGRYGAATTFDIPFVKRSIDQVLSKRTDILFLFVNTDRFMTHPRVLHLPAIYSKQEKSDFISTCDVMLHARYRGESFGLAIAEFLYHDRPFLCWAGGRDRNHLRMQPDSDNVYKTSKDLVQKLLTVTRYNDSGGRRRGAVAEFAAEAVSLRFANAFLSDDRPATLGSRTQLYYDLRRRVANRVNYFRGRFYERA
jgi:hypothetical protein